MSATTKTPKAKDADALAAEMVDTYFADVESSAFAIIEATGEAHTKLVDLVAREEEFDDRKLAEEYAAYRLGVAVGRRLR